MPQPASTEWISHTYYVKDNLRTKLGARCGANGASIAPKCYNDMEAVRVPLGTPAGAPFRVREAELSWRVEFHLRGLPPLRLSEIAAVDPGPPGSTTGPGGPTGQFRGPLGRHSATRRAVTMYRGRAGRARK
ncbi:unnamed protein product, partial [Iphiclides podalirius]